MSRVVDDRVSDEVWNAVQSAVAAGWNVEKFRAECASAWQEALRQAQEDARHAWKRTEPR